MSIFTNMDKNDPVFCSYVGQYFLATNIIASVSTFTSDNCFGGFAFAKNDGKCYVYAYGKNRWCSQELIQAGLDTIFNELNVDCFYFQILKSNVPALTLAKRFFPKIHTSTSTSIIYKVDSDSIAYMCRATTVAARRTLLKEFDAKYNRR